jgi:hypothetical protein
MRTITRTALVLACSAALAGSMALPASAADTTTTVTVQATGGIGITAPPSASAPTIAPGVNAVASLTGITVTDSRSGTTGWVASVSLGAFSGSTAFVIPTAGITNVPSAAVTGGAGTSTVAASTATGPLEQPSQTATGVSGDNTASWNATLTVPVPANALVGTYTATLTNSVL